MKRREFIGLAGGAAAWPFAAHAQQARKIPRIGVLFHAGSPEEEGPYFTAVIEGFKALGYIEGRNIVFEHRFPNEMPERFKSMAAELVSMKVDVLVSVSGLSAVYAKNATSTIPIVFTLVNDPVGSKLVDNLARPGGNATGLSNYQSDLTGRRLQIFKEVIPPMSRIAQLVNPTSPAARGNIQEIGSAASQLGLSVKAFEARSLADVRPAFDAMVASGMQGIIYGPGEGLQFQARELMAKLALERNLPLCAHSRENFEAGALMSYGTDQIALCRGVATYVDKILKGEKPGDIPVQGPTKFEFLLNLKVAKTLGIVVPPDVVWRADEAIE